MISKFYQPFVFFLCTIPTLVLANPFVVKNHHQKMTLKIEPHLNIGLLDPLNDNKIHEMLNEEQPKIGTTTQLLNLSLVSPKSEWKYTVFQPTPNNKNVSWQLYCHKNISIHYDANFDDGVIKFKSYKVGGLFSVDQHIQGFAGLTTFSSPYTDSLSIDGLETGIRISFK